MYFVYILECKDGSLYTGYTTDLEKRLKAHNESKAGAKYTKTRRPVKLVYFEKFRKLGLALKREYKIKQLTREEKLGLINKKC
jgi:putative endonuclease